MKFVNVRFTRGGRGGLLGWRVGFEAFGKLFCLERSTVTVGTEKYLTRNIIYAFGGTLRLHKFWRGDNDKASHTHPWNFWTFPLRTYLEQRFYHGQYVGTFVVKAWQWHSRPAFHEHIVIGAVSRRHLSWCHARDINEMCDCGKPYQYARGKPFWTIVVTGPKINEWGFYDETGKFTPWRDQP